MYYFPHFFSCLGQIIVVPLQREIYLQAIPMEKQYETQDGELLMANEPTESYPIGPGTIHLDISLDNNAVIADIKKAIEMIKGITGVRISVNEETISSGIDKGLDDIDKGNVFYAKNSADLVNQIFGCSR